VFRDFMIAGVSNGSVTSVGHGSIAYRNGRKLSSVEFYEAVDRPDLAATYRRRTVIGWTVALTGTAVALGASTWALFASGKPSKCEIGSPDFSPCLDRETDADHRRLVTSGVVMGGGLVVSLVGLYIVANRHPTSMNESHDLADAHNAKLRKRRGLPSATLAPYAAPDGGGLAMSGRF
jgi:hypothetical protein